jgi:CelD/BcsL family acetyltransferase involved in cellulose biosynthesis/predicted ATP-grasp superfamily ATP-dependent carboligase
MPATRATTLTAFRNAPSPPDLSRAAAVPGAERLREVPAKLNFQIYGDLAAVESDWRRFEREADCTAFQTFDWLSSWHRHIGLRQRVHPAIIVGRYSNDEIAFIMPLCVVQERLARRLCWLGQELCDYNAPLLAPDFSQRFPRESFLALWRELKAHLQCDPLLRYDWIEFEKMPQTIGSQLNPFTFLSVTPNASGAHLTYLIDDWEKFYATKRSSATRRRDRAKRRHMSEFGEVRFVTASGGDDSRRTLETLLEQKSRSLARRGIADIFARPGHREFFLDLASNPQCRHLFHISRVEVGSSFAAVNFGIVFGDCYYHVLASYDDGEIAQYGPGTMHLRELMAEAIRMGLKRFDFTIGDEPYKLEWSDATLNLHDFAAAATWRGLPARIASTVRRRIKRFIKQTPWAWRLASRARSTIGPLPHPLSSRSHPREAVISCAASTPPAVACVMGDMDLLRPVVLAGIPCAVVTRPGVPSLYSRYALSRLVWDDCSRNTEGLADALVRFGQAQSERPVLFYEEDAQVLFVSRHRERLAQAFRFVIADPQLVEDLLDKGRFQQLAERFKLPVPTGRRFKPAFVDPGDVGVAFPLIVKPLTRLEPWNNIFGLHKAIYVENAEALRNLWPQLCAVTLELLAQEFISGAEGRIESYHCYVDQRGGIAGEFTGRKIRTYPVCYGHTSALEITDADDVRRSGRAIVERLALTGVAKLDFKRDPRGDLRLLEINPRFNLWHHAGAVAGVNIPALVYADLVGVSRPPVAGARAGVRWCRMWKDLPAARAGGIPLAAWLHWALSCEAKSTLSWDDPMPLLRSTFHRVAGRHLGHLQAGSWQGRDCG